MTDERQGDMLWTALARLPRGAGIVFRHYRTSAARRHALFIQVRAVARRRGLTLVLGGTPHLALRWRADGVHGAPSAAGGSRLIRTASAHDPRALIHNRRADLLFVSPVFSTRSHPGARPLGRMRFATLAHTSRVPVIALGGVTPARAATLRHAFGWAAIDAWSAGARAPAQKRKAVPT